MRKGNFAWIGLVVGAGALSYAALAMDFSKMDAAALWVLAAFGVVTLGGIYWLVVGTEESESKRRK